MICLHFRTSLQECTSGSDTWKILTKELSRYVFNLAALWYRHVHEVLCFVILFNALKVGFFLVNLVWTRNLRKWKMDSVDGLQTAACTKVTFGVSRISDGRIFCWQCMESVQNGGFFCGWWKSMQVIISTHFTNWYMYRIQKRNQNQVPRTTRQAIDDALESEFSNCDSDGW